MDESFNLKRSAALFAACMLKVSTSTRRTFDEGGRVMSSFITY